jgi:membrane-bound serine protease (ClpP class)
MRWIRRGLLGLAAFGLLAAAATGGVLAASAATQQSSPSEPAGKTAVIAVDRTVETGLQSFMERALSEAEATGADTAILVIDTFGGRVDAAIAIGEEIRSSPLRTIAYVQGKAISAGSYIALSADEIYMQEGSTMGGAAVVNGSGERVRDSKIVSVWVEQMRSAAQRNDRDPAIAAGMVDDKLRVEMPTINRTNEVGQIITLSAKDAVAVGYAEGVVTSMEELLQHIGADTTMPIKPTMAEELARFLTHPATATVLMVLGIAGLLIELLVPGFGIPGIIGISAFGLYFLGNYVAGFAGVEHLTMFIVGVLLLVLELFIPSFGILGILGIISLISGVILAAYDTGNAMTSLGIAVLIAGVIVAVFVRYFKHRGVWNRFILRDTINTKEGYVSHKTREELIGLVGRAITPLRPSGMMLLNEERIDVVTNGEFIAAGAAVQVVHMEGIRVVVKEASPSLET